MFFRGTLLLTNATTIFAGLFSKNIAIIHHIDSRFSLDFKRLYDYICDKYLFCRKSAFDRIVVVAKVWYNILLSKGFKNVRIIYNSFDYDDFRISDNDVSEFKKQNGLNDKPIIYLGKGIKDKGADKCYNLLKDIDAHFITTGTLDFDIPVINLQLGYREYKILLASSDVVLAMSEFNEGWNRIVHEASLCGTPVVGSGLGGMMELLEIAGQTVSDFEHLHDNVLKQIGRKIPPTEALKSLDMNYFKNMWIKVFE